DLERRWQFRTSNRAVDRRRMYQLTDEQKAALIARYSGRFPVPMFSYGTVRDYCDSCDNLPWLSSVQNDLKDLQRPWTVKATLGLLPPGSRLLEIGAGQPLVAAWLANLGYRVTIVDPYDGSFHSVDCVSEGNDASYHFDQCVKISSYQYAMAGELPNRAEYEELLNRARDDIETCYLSAAGHNLWRAGLPYDTFPFRKVFSFQTATSRSKAPLVRVVTTSPIW